MATLNVRLVAPEKDVLDKNVVSVTLPAIEGLLGILPQHSPMLATLAPGVLSIVQDANTTYRYFIAGGSVEVANDKCVILAESCTPVDELKVPAYEQNRKALIDGRKKESSKSKVAKIDREIYILDAQQGAIEGKDYIGVPPHHLLDEPDEETEKLIF